MHLGCMNRPWNQEPIEVALDGIAGAGYDGVGLLRQQGQPVIAASTPPERVDEVAALCADRGLVPLMVMSTAGVDAAGLRAELLHLRRLGGSVLLHCGVGREEQYPAFYRAMRETAVIAADLGLSLAFKPHGGVSATADDCLRVLAEVDRPAFGLWYDPGNIRYYTNRDPVEDVQPLLGRIAGCCVKDCRGSRVTDDGDVNFEPGTGEVDLMAVFAAMVAAGFDGPCQVECLGGATLAEVNAAAARTRGRLAGWLGG